MTAIKFGTSGWRAIVAEEFTLANIRLAVAGIASYVKSQPGPHRVLVGRDPRFLGEMFVAATARVLVRRAGHHPHWTISGSGAPGALTPGVTVLESMAGPGPALFAAATDTRYVVPLSKSARTADLASPATDTLTRSGLTETA